MARAAYETLTPSAPKYITPEPENDPNLTRKQKREARKLINEAKEAKAKQEST